MYVVLLDFSFLLPKVEVLPAVIDTGGGQSGESMSLEKRSHAGGQQEDLISIAASPEGSGSTHNQPALKHPTSTHLSPGMLLISV